MRLWMQNCRRYLTPYIKYPDKGYIYLKTKILFFITEDWYFYIHWMLLAKGIRDAGYEVVIVTRVDKHRTLIEREGFRLIPLSMVRRSRNVFRELLSIIEMLRIYQKEKPDIVHHFAVKPILYGALAARIAGISRVVNTLAGLGFLFIEQGKKRQLMRFFAERAYKLAFSGEKTIGIFQNPDDMNLFVRSGVIEKRKGNLVKGTGVDLSVFTYSTEPEGVPIVLLASRMLWDKGIGELVEATRVLKSEGVLCRMVLAGSPDPENPASISETQLHNWQAKGLIEWWGYKTNIPEILKMSSIVVLPSYREGLPTGLLEAAACGRPIIATNVPGCREIVRHEENGLLVPAREPLALAKALKSLITNPELRKKLGKRGREIVVQEFSDQIVIKKTIRLYEKLIR